MKICLEIKNPKNIIKPTTDNIILFDGREWYVTTKDDVFKEYQQRMDERIALVDKSLKDTSQKLKEIERFKGEISGQIMEMGEIIKEFIRLKGE